MARFWWAGGEGCKGSFSDKKLSPYLAEPPAAGSGRNLPKAKPIRGGGVISVQQMGETVGRICERITLQTLGSVQKKGEEVLQMLEKSFACSPR